MKSGPSTKLRAREVIFAVALGALGAGGAALILDDDDERHVPAVAVASGQPSQLGPFEEISTVGPQDVVVITGESYSVRSEGSPDALARLEAVVEDGKLVIRPKGNFASGFNWSRVAGATFYVTTPRLDAVSLAGSGDMRIDRIDGGTFRASIAGPGELDIDAMAVDTADFSIAGSGSVVAAGTAQQTRASIMGSGEVEAKDLRSQTADVSMAGSGDAELTVEGEARVSIMGSGDVEIAGPARCTVSRMGSGEVRCESSSD
jgi:hypothetical protein